MVVIRTSSVRGPAAEANGLSSMDDFARWRGELRSIADLSAFRDDARNLIIADGRTYLLRVAVVTASGFGLTGAAPVLGRTLLAEDEQPSAAPVVVIAYDEWQRRCSADAAVLGRIVRLDETPHTIVGVMPEGFGFPINHRYWVPLRTTGLDSRAAASPTMQVFGRLGEGFSLADARAELKTIGERMAATLPESHKDLRPRVLSYTNAFFGVEGPEAELAIRAIQFGVSLLLLVVAVNVAILVYARTATRTGEIAVRTAIGASRARVVTQMFVEALVPAVVAMIIGLGLLTVALIPFRDYLRNSPEADGPYWITVESLAVSRGAVIYAAVLAMIAAAITGVLPALKATGTRVQARLQQFSARGSGLRLGDTWTALIALQVAVAVAALPPVLYKAERAHRVGMREAPSTAAPLLRATLAMSGDATPARDAAARAEDVALFTARMTAWLQKLESEPGVAAVTYAERFPGEERVATVEIDVNPSQRLALRAQPNRMATNFFDVIGVRVLAGRGFTNADANNGSTAIIVDESFADRLGAGGVLGRRVRFTNRPSPGEPEQDRWFDVVGVVPAFTAAIAPPVGFRDALPRFYLAAAPGDDHPVTAIVKINGGDPTHFSYSERLTAVAASVHPTLKLYGLAGVVHDIDRERQVLRTISVLLIVVTASVLLLSAAGIYAMMSFTVAKRRREIGIRVALGADGRRVLMGIFGRAAAQIGAGIAAGLAVIATMGWLGGADVMGERAHVLLPAVAGLMSTVGILAAVGPARRGLALPPTEALRGE